MISIVENIIGKYVNESGINLSKKLEINETRTSSGRVTRTTVPKEVSSKIKFYDYNIEFNKPWWDEFIKKL